MSFLDLPEGLAERIIQCSSTYTDRFGVLRVGFLRKLRVGCLLKELNMPQPKTLRQKIQSRVARTKKTDVFLQQDFADLSGEDPILRALRSLVHDGALMRRVTVCMPGRCDRA